MMTLKARLPAEASPRIFQQIMSLISGWAEVQLPVSDPPIGRSLMLSWQVMNPQLTLSDSDFYSSTSNLAVPRYSRPHGIW